ncbi:EAL domain-containing protein [Marinobacter sp. LQ44]|uniref:EAL domain-containing protein n=1 Tax=unclassified Marinobacter TaxID=83889 RepID=UPI000719054C|nr:EAL domain-containing protein [Marinobacter sp. LQ44]AMQ89446.1 diguanylate phosphodiesterase [Marinobacter sp. LQ44]
MDSEPANQTSRAPLTRLPFLQSLNRWFPFLILFLAAGYGLTAALLSVPSATPEQTLTATIGSAAQVRLHPQSHYLLAPLAEVLEQQRWHSGAWEPLSIDRAGIGYPRMPATFRMTLTTEGQEPVNSQLVVPAPYLDHLQPALIHPDGTIETLPVMGDQYPFDNRYVALPQWIWPVTLQPGETVLLMEVRNSGPVMLPLSVAGGNEVVSEGTFSTAWKSFVTGLLVFALLLNLSIVAKLKRPGLAWLSVLMIGVIYSQLVMDGLGLWLFWPGMPELNSLLSVSLSLCLIALCEFTPHFMAIHRTGRRILRGFSIAAGLHLLAAPLTLPLLGQDVFLIISAAGGAFILALVLSQLRKHVYARYYALSVLAIVLGAVISSLRTIGWFPVTPLTDSAFFLGAAAGSLILTSGVGRLLLEERKRRLSSDIRVQEEQKLRARIERDYDRVLKTHRVTGKPNRPMLEETLGNIDCQQTPYNLCLIRLARFNELEQALGYRTAEDLLKQYLRRLNRYLKRTLGDRLIMINGYGIATLDTVNHAFAMDRGSDPAQDRELLETISHWLSENFREGRFSFSWAASMGVAYAPEHGTDAASVLSSAGFASLDETRPMAVYDPAIADWQYQQQILMLDVEDALRCGDMWLEYQPKVSIRDGKVRSAEALIRWQHPEFGRIPPDHWIPLAEQVGIIHSVTLWVLDQACQDFAPLQQRYGESIGVAVNISAKDVAHPLFHEEAGAITRRHGVSPDRVILEITETAAMADPEVARRAIRTLSSMGFRIALDDFGSGHSSLGNLASFPLDELKIDRSFLQDVLLYPVRQKILRAALELGEALDLDVVVEGVEDEAIALWLQQFPGLHGQGYYWARPERVRAALVSPR